MAAVVALSGKIGDLMQADAAKLFLAGDRPKIYRAGTHRAEMPETTLSQLRPHFQRMGLTRLAEITGLDSVGIPVVQAIRPMARNLSVNQGKGLSLSDAQVSAAMESAETWHAERPPGNRVRGRRVDLMADGLVLDPAEISARPASPGCHDDVEMSWYECVEIFTGQPILAPIDCISMDYSVPPETDLIARSSNGLASGNTPAEALAAALFEVVERDCVAEFAAMDGARKDRCRVSRKALRASAIAEIVSPIESNRLWLEVWDITNDIGIPAFSALITEPASGRKGYRIAGAAGSGAHLDPIVALSRAVTEALQTRLTLISGVREDIDPEAYNPAGTEHDLRIPAAMFGDGVACDLVVGNQSGASSGEDVRRLLAKLKQRGITQIAVVDLTRQEIGLPVLRVVVPGLALVLGSGRYRRARRMASGDKE